MVKIKYRQRISITGKSRGQRKSKFHKDKLKNGLTAREYRNEIENFLQTPSNIEDQTLEIIWKHIKQSINKASEKILGYYTKKKRNEWYDEEYRTVLEIRNAARMKMLQRKTRTNIQEYKKAQREAKLVCKRKKRQSEEEELEELQERYRRNELRKFYEGIRKIREGFQPRTSICKSKQGLIIGYEERTLEVWAEYFKELLNPQFNGITPEENTYFGPDWNIKPPTVQ
jgi:hypothetical protein